MKIKVALISAGLGNVSRGFEISAATWFQTLKQNPKYTFRLFSGGNYPESTVVTNLSRNGWISSMLRRMNVIKDGCRLEQVSFAFGFILHIIRFKPDVIWLQEISLAQWLLKFRRWFGFSYKIAFCDGAPVGHHLAKSFDHIIFLHEYARLDALKDAVPDTMISVIPHVSVMPATYTEKSKAKKHFNIPQDNFVILCVAAWNTHHKRIDYLIEEVALLIKTGQNNITLLLCGQPEKEAASLKALAESKKINAVWKTLSSEELAIAYNAADVFVLPSLTEGLGAVLIEAGFHNLPVICHHHDPAKFIFGETYSGLTDLSTIGNLVKKIQKYQSSDRVLIGVETGQYVKNKFAPAKLSRDFCDMIQIVYQS